MNHDNTETHRFPIRFLGRIAADALLKEVGTTPKPGLVDLHDNGAHSDMCHQTFVDSTAAIVPYLTQMAQLGFSWSGEPAGLFRAIRPLGIQAEQAMFAATGGVNTHKGLIFSLGIIMAASGLYFQKHGCFDSGEILALCRVMTCDILEEDFASIDRAHPKTHGERLYVLYGCRGIRGEAQTGFASVRRRSLPLLKTLSPSAEEENLAFLQVLLLLMSEVHDTNVLTRSGPESAAAVSRLAGELLTGWSGSPAELYDSVSQMNESFIRQNISPGGCADLLAVTIFLWLLEQYEGGLDQS